MLKVATQPAKLPEDCRKQLFHNLASGDRLDTAYWEVTGLLKAQNSRISRCADWHDGQNKEKDEVQ